MDWLWKRKSKIRGENGKVKRDYSVLQRDLKVCSENFLFFFYSRIFFSILKLILENFEYTEKNKDDNRNTT